MVSQTERLNIKDIVMKEPPDESAKFDVSRDISSSDWANMLEVLRFSKEASGGFNTRYPEMLMNIYILDPERIDLNQIQADDDSMTLLTLKFRAARINNQRAGAIRAAAPLKILFPKKNLKLDFYEAFGSQVADLVGDPLESFKEYTTGNFELADKLDFLASVKIVYPDQMKKLIDNLEVRKSLEKAFCNFTGPVYAEIQYLASIKILIGDESKLDINDESWRNYKDYLERQKILWGDFAYIAHWLKILAAEKVLVSENGLRLFIDMPEFKGPALALPETRRF